MKLGCGQKEEIGCWVRGLRLVVTVLILSGSAAFSFCTESATELKAERWFHYTNEVNEEIPLSIHVVKVDRGHHEFGFCTTLGKGNSLGMAVVSEQVKLLGQDFGQPLAAINGDFYEKSEKYMGRARDIQIRFGEVISTPAGHSSFWMDSDGNPHMTNITSRFRVEWPGGKTTAIGLNQQREDNAAVLYTAVTGASTRTSGGLEFTLENADASRQWLPLRVGQTYNAKVRQVRDSGDSPLREDILVLSLGSSMASQFNGVRAGYTVKIITETLPDLSGAPVAIGGGPALVVNGKPMQWQGFIHMRHPRTALGWNKESLFMVEVDGRQSNLSVGMTFAELANYLIKLGCTEALNFDGGGSATMWALGAVRNSPSEGDERPSPNALVLFRTKKPAGH